MLRFEHLEQSLWKNYVDASKGPLSLLDPLKDLSLDSGTLILGYGGGQIAIRSEMIPYFHIVGQQFHDDPLHVLLVAGWLGTDRLSVLSLASLLGVMENRLRVVGGMEVTAFPAMNMEALRSGEYLTSKQQLEGVRLWSGSSCTHVRVLENEFQRYPYGVAVVLRENPSISHFHVTNWPSTHGAETVLTDSLKRLKRTGGDLLEWSVDPDFSRIARSFTPLPQDRPCTELAIEIPSGGDASLAKEHTLGLVLTLMHAARQGRMEGLL